MGIAILSSVSLYAACMGFFHANPKRTAWARIRSDKKAARFLASLSWILVSVALTGFIHISGWEHGLAIWTGMFIAAGMCSLLVSALLPAHHVKSLFAALAVSIAAYLIGTTA